MKDTKTDTRAATDFADRLRELTQEFGSRYALAKVSGIPASTLQGYEAGAKPGMEALLTLARVGNVDLRWLLTGDGEIRPAGLLPGAALADVLMADQYELGTPLGAEVIINQIPFSRHVLETKLGLKGPTYETVLVVEAAWDLYRVKRCDLVLIDRNQADLGRDGVYLLDLPGMALRAVSRSVGDKVHVTGPEQDPTWSSKRQQRTARGEFSTMLEMSRSELQGAGRHTVSKVVGRAVWVGGAI
jgi:transcriptional regulator with XRE-family HTH domain